MTIFEIGNRVRAIKDLIGYGSNFIGVGDIIARPGHQGLVVRVSQVSEGIDVLLDGAMRVYGCRASELEIIPEPKKSKPIQYVYRLYRPAFAYKSEDTIGIYVALAAAQARLAEISTELGNEKEDFNIEKHEVYE